MTRNGTYLTGCAAIVVVVLAGLAGLTETAEGAHVDYFLKIPGAEGESTMTESDPRMEALKRRRLRPSMKCAKVEFAYSCVSNDPIHLARINCRPGSTEASCCKAVRAKVSAACKRRWEAARRSRKVLARGIFLCKCIASPVRRKIRRKRLQPRP